MINYHPESPQFCSLFIAATWPAATEEKFRVPFARVRSVFLKLILFFQRCFLARGGGVGGWNGEGIYYYYYYFRISFGGGLPIIQKRAWPNFGYGSERKVRIPPILWYLSGLATSYIIFTNAENFNQILFS
jgi:hypothetical protein